jgi:hypothetical protein
MSEAIYIGRLASVAWRLNQNKSNQVSPDIVLRSIFFFVAALHVSVIPGFICFYLITTQRMQVAQFILLILPDKHEAYISVASNT